MQVKEVFYQSWFLAERWQNIEWCNIVLTGPGLIIMLLLPYKIWCLHPFK
jgi:hypothetical protein